MKEFKYFQTFATKHVRIVVPEDKSKQLALASLEDLKDVLPPGLDIAGNPDLVFNSFNAVVVNRINGNDDGIRTDAALAIASKFIHKPLDLEHNRKFIVGSIISQGYSEFLTNKTLSAAQIKDYNKPFNITLGGVVWSIFNPDFADELVESSDETSPKYETISASWEIGFNDYQIALGSKDLGEAELITDSKQIEEFTKFLRVSQGSGKTNDGVPVYRVITGEALPLGVGYTTTPAAEVKGIIVAGKENSSTIKANVIELSEDAIIKFGESSIKGSDIIENFSALVQIAAKEKNQQSEKNNSQVGNVVVNNNSNMKFQKLDDITEDLFKDEAVAAKVQNFLGKFVNDQIDEVSTKYAEQLETKEKEAKAEKEASEKAKQEAAEAVAEVTKVREELKKEQDARAAQKAEADFNNRMSDLDSKFDLEDKDRSFIAADIKGLDDEMYAKWVEKFEVFAAKKKKDPEFLKKQAEEKAKKEKESKASAEDLLNKAKENETKTLPNGTVTEGSIKDEFKDFFEGSIFKK